jgi:quinoprotein glucose dehydrogenase
MVTAGGLVFCSGTADSKIRAFDSGSGAELWSAALPYIGTAPPATYQVGGRQFVVVTATGGGKLYGHGLSDNSQPGDAYVAFTLEDAP